MDAPFFPAALAGLPVQLEVHDFKSGAHRRVGPYDVQAIRIYHPAPALAYRIEADGRSLVYATDTEDAFNGETNPVIALARGANTLIHDAQFLDRDFKRGWGHSTIASAIDVAVQAEVGRLLLFHHDPDRSDNALDAIAIDAQRTAHARRPTLEVVIAREGLELAV